MEVSHYLINFIFGFIKKIKEIRKKAIKGANNKYEEMIKNDKNSENNVTSNKPMERRLMYGICSTCKKVREHEDWCKFCQTENFKKNFKNWTSGDSKVDELIQKSQLNAKDGLDYLEWIDYKKIKNIEYITRGGFGKIFKGIWVDGPKHTVEAVKHDWRQVPNITIALKEMDHNDQFNRLLDEVNFKLIFFFSNKHVYCIIIMVPKFLGSKSSEIFTYSSRSRDTMSWNNEISGR
jgi:hypothetical protein